MQKQIDLRKVVKKVDNTYFHFIVAFDNDESRGSITNNLYYIKEALNKYSKLFFQIGFFVYNTDCNEPCFIFDDPSFIKGIVGRKPNATPPTSVTSTTLENLNDEYYDKYRYPRGGYGIYLDKELNVEYGYTTVTPIDDFSSRATYHDFKDARDGDIIKEHIFSLLDNADIRTAIVREGYDKEVDLSKLVDLKTEILCFVNDKCFDIRQEKEILKELNKERTPYWRRIYGILNIVLDNGGKLYFELSEDEGIFVIRKNEYKDVSQVGKYSPEEGEILLDKESDEDIYINTHVFKPKFTSMDEVNALLKDKKINLDETMRHVSMPDFYAGPTVEAIYGGIYIHTVYVSEGGSGGKIYEYEIDDDDFVTVGIHSGLGDYDLRLPPQCYTGDEAGDYGIEVFDDGTIMLCETTSGICGGTSSVRDLSEPLNAFVIEILMNTLVFEDSLSDEGVMYCPDCGEDYDNGEELCPDCGTKLVTEFEITMLEYKEEL